MGGQRSGRDGKERREDTRKEGMSREGKGKRKEREEKTCSLRPESEILDPPLNHVQGQRFGPAFVSLSFLWRVRSVPLRYILQLTCPCTDISFVEQSIVSRSTVSVCDHC